MSKYNDELDSFADALNSFKEWRPTLLPNEKSYEYYKGFHDATRQFMQTFEKLIEAGAFGGTKSNSNN